MPKFHPLLKEMRECIPVPGDTWVKDIDVLIEPGQGNHQGQAMHEHDEWTAIFYVAVGSPVVPILIEGEKVEPTPGEVLILPPRTLHAVARSDSREHRLSFAMLVPDPDIPTKFSEVMI